MVTAIGMAGCAIVQFQRPIGSWLAPWTIQVLLNPPGCCRGQTQHYIRRVYKIGATPTVLLFIKFGLIRLLPWRPLNCAPWFRAIKLKIADAREHHEFPRLRKYRFAAPTATRAIAVASRRQTRLPSRPSQVKFQARMAKQKARGTHPT